MLVRLSKEFYGFHPDHCPSVFLDGSSAMIGVRVAELLSTHDPDFYGRLPTRIEIEVLPEPERH